MQLIPAALVPVARNLLANQGMNPAEISDSGDISPSALFSLAYDKVTIYSKLHPPYTIDLKSPSSGLGQKFIDQVQPAIVFTGRAGRYEIAPGGIPTEEIGSGLLLGLGVGVVGLIAAKMLLFRR